MSTPALTSVGPRASASTYPGGPEHVRRVRTDMRRLLDGCPVADDVILCASELATNAAVHSDSRRSGGTFIVRTESCPGAGVRGLDIVRTLADDWGITTTPAGRAVWAHITWPAPRATGLAQPDEAA